MIETRSSKMIPPVIGIGDMAMFAESRNEYKPEKKQTGGECLEELFKAEKSDGDRSSYRFNAGSL